MLSFTGAHREQRDESCCHHQNTRLDPERGYEESLYTPKVEPDARFEFGLDALVRGIETKKG